MGIFDCVDLWWEELDQWEGIASAPARRNRKRLRGFRIMKNDFLEDWFASSHWIMPGIWFLPLIAWTLYLSLTGGEISVGATVVVWFAGVLAWTLVEYWLHRRFFHLPPGTNRLRRFVLFIAHGYHHEFPNDPRRLVAPPILSWPIAAALAALFYLVAGPAWLALFAGTASGYLAYDWMHYYTHHAKPKTRAGKFMRRFHLEHHFKDHETQFGLSSPLWDLVFGTFRAPERASERERRILAAGDARA